MTKPPTSYGPIQLCNRVGLTEWQRERALAEGLIPAPETGGRWSAAVVDDLAARAEEIRAVAGTIPDCGAGRAADHLTERLGVDVHSNTIVELAARGIIPEVGEYKGWPLYSGRVLELFDDRAVLDDAAREGELLTADRSAERMQIRRSDFDHLTRAGLLSPTVWVRSGHRPKRYGPDTPLYRAGTLAALLADGSIDWNQVRATPSGRQSPLASLPSQGNTINGDGLHPASDRRKR